MLPLVSCAASRYGHLRTLDALLSRVPCPPPPLCVQLGLGPTRRTQNKSVDAKVKRAARKTGGGDVQQLLCAESGRTRDAARISPKCADQGGTPDDANGGRSVMAS